MTLLTGAGATVHGAAAERLHAALARCWALLRRAEMLPTAVCSRSTLVLNKHMHTHTHSFDGNCLQMSRVRDTLGMFWYLARCIVMCCFLSCLGGAAGSSDGPDGTGLYSPTDRGSC